MYNAGMNQELVCLDHHRELKLITSLEYIILSIDEELGIPLVFSCTCSINSSTLRTVYTSTFLDIPFEVSSVISVLRQQATSIFAFAITIELQRPSHRQQALRHLLRRLQSRLLHHLLSHRRQEQPSAQQLYRTRYPQRLR